MFVSLDGESHCVAMNSLVSCNFSPKVCNNKCGYDMIELSHVTHSHFPSSLDELEIDPGEMGEDLPLDFAITYVDLHSTRLILDYDAHHLLGVLHTKLLNGRSKMF